MRKIVRIPPLGLWVLSGLLNAFLTRFTIVASSAHWLQVIPFCFMSTKSNRFNVINYCCLSATFYTDRMPLKKHFAELTPLFASVKLCTFLSVLQLLFALACLYPWSFISCRSIGHLFYWVV
jgi:hypothetical protein